MRRLASNLCKHAACPPSYSFPATTHNLLDHPSAARHKTTFQQAEEQMTLARVPFHGRRRQHHLPPSRHTHTTRPTHTTAPPTRTHMVAAYRKVPPLKSTMSAMDDVDVKRGI